jgi:superfamily II DNA or RNA helicase
MIILRDFQLTCVNELNKLNSACLIAPTGAGKTMIGSALAWREISNKGRVAFVVPRDNLARQSEATFRKWGLNSGFILGGERENRSAPIQIVSYQSLGSKKRSLKWLEEVVSLWIIDEAHICAFAKSLEHPLARAKRKIGLTATPYQMGGKRSLLQIFDQPVFAPTPRQLMEMGYLATPIYFQPRLDKSKKLLDAEPQFIYEQWEKFAYDEKTFIFCGSVAESDNCAAYFKEQGIETASVTSLTSQKAVEEAFTAFRSGSKLRVLVSCRMLAEGCDMPDATCVVLANRTESKSGYVQRVGRGARVTFNKKLFKVIDCIGLVKKFGPLEDIRFSAKDFELKDPIEGDIPQKECANCGAYNWISARVCSCCNEPFEITSAVYEDPGELQRLTKDDSEARAIALFHSLLLADFKKGGLGCEKEFYKTHGYYPLDHWVLDAPMPENLDSAPVRAAWKSYKRLVASRLPKEYTQLALPGIL